MVSGTHVGYYLLGSIAKFQLKFCNLAAIHIHPFPTERISSEQFCNQTYSDFLVFMCFVSVFVVVFSFCLFIVDEQIISRLVVSLRT